MPEEKSEEKKDFVIKDRRFFSEENKDNKADEKEKQDKNDPPKPETRSEKKESASDKKQEKEYQLPQINFPTFIFSLSSSVYVQLGLLEDPATGNKEKNLPLAKQTIDILGMLEEKTRGNLTHEEENMLKNILYDLRMLYVKEKE